MPSSDPFWKRVDQDTIDTRNHLIVVIEELVKARHYFERTFYLAVSICDRYMHALLRKGESPDNLVNLAVTSVYIAAKLE